MGAEETVLAQSGWAANVGLLHSIAAPDVPVYLDIMAHASLWDGVQLGGAKGVRFLHNNMDHLKRQLDKHGAGVIVVDALYSSDGSLAPLDDVVALAEKSGSVLVVDESHSLGTHRPRRHHHLFEPLQTLLPVGVAPGHLQLLPAEPRAGLVRRRHRFRRARRRPPRRAAPHHPGRAYRPGVPGGGDRTKDAGAARGARQPRHPGRRVLCPATPKNRALVRLTLNAGLARREIAKLLDACADMREEVDLDSWTSTVRRRRVH